MRIIFVRHGHPNYEKDCLTPLGHLHGQAVAQRLQNEPVQKIYSSTCGRAMETAGHIDEVFNLGVLPLDFMREVSWGSIDGTPIYEDGHMWFTSEYMVSQGITLMNPDWQKTNLFQNNKVSQEYDRVSFAFDKWLSSLGYTREGEFYRAGKPEYETIVLVSHGGSSSVVLSHLFNLPLSFVCSAICPDYTAVTVVSFPDKEGSLVSPQFEIANDSRHIDKIKKQNNAFA